MSEAEYNEPVLTPEALVALLRKRGMEIQNEEDAILSIRRIGYHRLKTYWWRFEEDHDSHRLHPGTNFDDILNIYNFDQRLRTLLMDAIAPIEVSVRAEWSYQMAIVGGAYAYRKEELAKNVQQWQQYLFELRGDAGRASEETRRHFRDKYQNTHVPIWAVCETMSFSQLSRWYKNLGHKGIRRCIAEAHDVDDMTLESWLHHLSFIRNICAHHGRLWHRNVSIAAPRRHNRTPSVLKCALTNEPRIYNTLLVLLYLTDALNYTCWRGWVQEALQKQTDEFLVSGGFPADWREQSIWQTAG